MANAARAFDALGDPTRRHIFERLAKKPLAVGDLTKGLAVTRPLTRPAVSQHLKVLSGAGLVTVHQVGTRRFYQVDPRGVEAMRDYLDRHWDKALSAFKQFAESQGDSEPVHSQKKEKRG